MMRSIRRVMVAMAIALASCQYSYGPGSLAPGASAYEVRDRMGPPTDEEKQPDGTRVWWYVRGPQGYDTYRIVIGLDDRVASIEQVLTEQNFARLQPGMSKTDVLSRIGRPRQQMKFPNLAEEVWTWRYRDGTIEKLFHVHFDNAGLMKRSSAEHETTNP